MKKYFVVILVLILGIFAQAQSDAPSLEIAKATLKAHGGEKLNQAKTMVLRGSVDVSAPNSAQTLPASFAIVLAGEKYRFEIQSAIFNFQQISDGFNTSSSIPGFSLPPINRVGLFILPRIEEAGFLVSPLPEKFKKKKGFRVTSPEGDYLDFLVDEKTSLVKEYESSYQYGGRLVSTSVAIEKYKEVDGVLVNEKFSQRLDLGQNSAYANFKATNISINSEVANDIFIIK